MVYFEELLDRSALPDPRDIQPADSDLPSDCNATMKEEIQNAIKQLRNDEAAGPGHIPAEALKVDIRTNVELLYPLFNKIWEEQRVPTNWKNGYLIKLFKIGDLSFCPCYRGITLLSIRERCLAESEQDERCHRPTASRTSIWFP